MLSKLRKLYEVLSNKTDQMLVQYRVQITVRNTNPPAAFVEIVALNADGTKDLYKFGDVTNFFDLHKYIQECIEDLQEK